MHGGVEHDEATNDYVEVLNECVKSQLKLEDKSVLSKHIQSKHRGAVHDEALNECVESQLKVKNDSVLSKHIQSKHQAFFKKLATRAERLEKKFGHPEDGGLCV